MLAGVFVWALSSSSVITPFATSTATSASSRELVSTVALMRAVAFSTVGVYLLVDEGLDLFA